MLKALNNLLTSLEVGTKYILKFLQGKITTVGAYKVDCDSELSPVSVISVLSQYFSENGDRCIK